MTVKLNQANFCMRDMSELPRPTMMKPASNYVAQCNVYITFCKVEITRYICLALVRAEPVAAELRLDSTPSPAGPLRA